MLGKDRSIHLHCRTHYDAGKALHDFHPSAVVIPVSPSSSCSLRAPPAILRIIFIRNWKLKWNGTLSFPGPDLVPFNAAENKTSPKNKFKAASWLPRRSSQTVGKGWRASPLQQRSLPRDLYKYSTGTTKLLWPQLCENKLPPRPLWWQRTCRAARRRADGRSACSIHPASPLRCASPVTNPPNQPPQNPGPFPQEAGEGQAPSSASSALCEAAGELPLLWAPQRQHQPVLSGRHGETLSAMRTVEALRESRQVNSLVFTALKWFTAAVIQAGHDLHENASNSFQKSADYGASQPLFVSFWS